MTASSSDSSTAASGRGEAVFSLLISAVIEARSCERLMVVNHRADDDVLATFIGAEVPEEQPHPLVRRYRSPDHKHPLQRKSESSNKNPEISSSTSTTLSNRRSFRRL